MLALIPAGVAVAVGVLALIWLIGLAYLYMIVVYPIIEWITKPRGGFLTRQALRPLKAVAGATDRFAREQLAALHRWVASNQRPATILLLSMAEVTQRTAGTLGDMAEQTYIALRTLRQDTIPRLITQALAPIRSQLQRHTGRLDALEDLNRRVAVEIGTSLRELPWGAPGGYVSNFGAWLNSYVALYRHYWNVTREQLNTLLNDTVPELRRDVADLARRLDVQIDARFDALGARISELERWRETVVMPRLDALAAGLDLLADQVFEEVAGGLTALLERIAELERQVSEVIPAAIAALDARLEALRTDLEEGIRTGLGVFSDRLEALELEVFQTIPARFAALELAIETLAGEVLGEVGAGLTALTARILAIEETIANVILPRLELELGRIELLEETIRDNILPRLRAIEELLTPAALAVAVLAALRIAAPNLFCRNVTDVTRRICADDESFWTDLLAGALVFAIALNPREIAAAGTALTGAIGGVISETVDH